MKKILSFISLMISILFIIIISVWMITGLYNEGITVANYIIMLGFSIFINVVIYGAIVIILNK